MNGVWKCVDDNAWQWENYKIYRSVMGFTVWHWGDHSRRVGDADLMSKAMEMARLDSAASSRTGDR
jgi:hypothetical protein